MQRSFFTIGSVIVLLFILCLIPLYAQMDSTHVDSDVATIHPDFSADKYLFIGEHTNYKDFLLQEDFFPGLKYGKERKDERMEGRRGPLFCMQAKNNVPINIYYNKRTKYIFMIEVLPYDVKQRYYLRDYLYENGTDLGGLNRYFGMTKASLQKKLGSGKKNKWILQECLEYPAKIGIISFVISKSPGTEEYISGVRILFNNHEGENDAVVK